jgi:hypothetical protein
MEAEKTNALERVARLERENAELRERIDRARAGHPPRPSLASKVDRFAIARWILLTAGAVVGLRFAICATRAERTAADLGAAALTTCEGAP